MSALEVICWACGALQLAVAVVIIVNWWQLPDDEVAQDNMYLLATMLSGGLVFLAM